MNTLRVKPFKGYSDEELFSAYLRDVELDHGRYEALLNSTAPKAGQLACVDKSVESKSAVLKEAIVGTCNRIDGLISLFSGGEGNYAYHESSVRTIEGQEIFRRILLRRASFGELGTLYSVIINSANDQGFKIQEFMTGGANQLVRYRESNLTDQTDKDGWLDSLDRGPLLSTESNGRIRIDYGDSRPMLLPRFPDDYSDPVIFERCSADAFRLSGVISPLGDRTQKTGVMLVF